MLRVNQLIGFGSGGGVSTLVDRTTGTNIGSMTSGGGLAAAFDGNSNIAYLTGPTAIGTTPGYVGKTFVAPKVMDKAICHASNDKGFIFLVDVSMTLNLRGKNGAPASSSDGTLLGTLTFTDTSNESAGRTVLSTVSTPFTSIWVELIGSGAGGHDFTEIEFYELL